MYYELFDISDPQSLVLVEKVYYEYQGQGPSKGHPTRVVHAAMDPVTHQPATYAAADLTYNHQGELWFVTEQHWAADDVFCDYRVRDRITEFRGSGRARHMVRQRDATLDEEHGDMYWSVLPETAVWSDYDGDEIYGDFVIDPTTGALSNKTAYLPGIGQMDSQTSAVTYHHADHLGTLRATTDAAGQVLSHLVLTTFGETVAADGTVGTRYQYAGEWGYESGLGSPGHGGAAGASALPWQHVGHRWYDPSTGRFLQRDPIGILGGLNAYSYCGNNPLASADPQGLKNDWGLGDIPPSDRRNFLNDPGDPPLFVCVPGWILLGMLSAGTVIFVAPEAAGIVTVAGPAVITQEVKRRATQGADGGISEIIITRVNGVAVQVSHFVRVNGKIVHDEIKWRLFRRG